MWVHRTGNSIPRNSRRAYDGPRMVPEPERDTTRFLVDGRRLSSEELVPVVYADLRRMAGQFFRREAAHRTLQPTALVNEAYLRLSGQKEEGWENRAQFLAIAARCMRRVLVDAARERKAEKRVDELHRVSFHDRTPDGAGEPDLEVDVVDLDRALERIGEVKERYLELVELRFFGGLSLEEVAEVLGISRTMVVREWTKARTWLAHYLRDYGPEADGAYAPPEA